MPAPCLPSRSSIDLGVPKSLTQTGHKHARPHPPRLQHSPSLPNIWFPQHSRSLPTSMLSTASNPIQNPARSATPSAPSSQQSPNAPQNPQSKSHHEERPTAHENVPLKSSDSRRNAIKTTPSYTRRHQRKDRNPPQHPLTPPLTPSSSIRTNASTDSTDGNSDDKIQTLQEMQEPEATRFLHLENVSRVTPSTTLQNAIADALRHLPLHRNLNSTTLAARNTEAIVHDTSCIKGFHLGQTKTNGSLFLAFYDIRDAIAAKLILSQRTDGVLAECLDEDKLIDGTQAWFRCEFITAEDLVKTIGNSNFLATTDGGFVLSVTFVDHAGNDGSETRDSDEARRTRTVSLSLLAKLLKSYGTLRLMKKKCEFPNSQSFLVEFFDARDASEAQIALDGQIMFGMELHASAGLPLEPAEKDVRLVITCNKGLDRADTPLSNHQSSASESHLPKLRPTIGPPGEASHVRGRFVSEVARSRPRAVSVGNETSSSVSPTLAFDRQPKASSPTIFYTSFDFTDSYSTTARDANDKVAIGRVSDHNDDVSDSNRHFKPWELQQACSIADCRYCPSRGHEPTVVHQPPNPPLIPPFVNPLSFPIQSPSPHLFVAPEFEAPVTFPGPGWSIDPNMMALAPGGNLDMFTPTFIPAVPVVPIEHRFPEQNPNPSFVPNGIVFPAIPPALHAPPSAFVKPQVPVSLDHNHIFVSNPVEPAPQADVDVNIKLSNPSLGVNDRNFLNISRIEEGLDTRTTVMIKNIPNKMTAKDLIQYINEVAPRKIDFLYLRMDFKNGCNVGYAFVNFIRVQDMLKFAKKRLGVKWNLFSSEKVLQMSYANYQGKEALVEKFKNSCIMDEREEWRPKIFYSSGPEQGLPEPFPAPTHLRRKERSSHNRGALYVPGAPNVASAGTGYLNNGPSHRQEFYSASGPKYLEHRTRSVDRCTESTFGSGRRGRAHLDRSR
ncbi:Meiosis protein mei2 [Leucoagaricus sp. SymC.cos]|nr:Meiosis protein mei2 [Leucoagaricus sp. SymC.cos]